MYSTRKQAALLYHSPHTSDFTPKAMLSFAPGVIAVALPHYLVNLTLPFQRGWLRPR